MPLHRFLPLIACALLLGLAACGGGGSSGGMKKADPEVVQSEDIATAIGAANSAVQALNDESTDTQIDAAVAAVAAARQEVAQAETLSAAEKSVFEDRIDDIADDLDDARTNIRVAREERRREMDEEREKLTTALFSTDRISSVSVLEFAHDQAPTMSGTLPGTPPTPVAGIETAGRGAATSVGSWTGRTYEAADAVSGAIDTVVLYSDISEPGSRPFSGEGGKYDDTNGLAADGSLAIAKDTDATLIDSAEFSDSAGFVTHESGEDGTVQVGGTFDGAQGIYLCTPSGDSPCQSQVLNDGGWDLRGGGGWRFVPAPGAMVPVPDVEYRYFGWWLRDTGAAQAVGTFHAGVGGAQNEFAGLAALQGPASYRGPAAGKYALNPPLGASTAGDFTATVILHADFGDGTDVGTISGTVDEILVGGEKMPWRVALETAGIGAQGSISAVGDDTAGTVWSIEGAAGAVPGTPPTWQGQLHEVNAQQVPSATTGVFDAVYGEIGRMIGAFGATLQE